MINDLATAIINKDATQVQALLSAGVDVNDIDCYGFTPLIEAAIVNELSLARTLLEHGADPKEPDQIGGTALHWAVENNNIQLANLLLEHGADPNAYNYCSEPVLAKAILRGNKPMRQSLIQAGANLDFARDYIYFKLLGHRFSLRTSIDMVDHEQRFTNLNLEGFFLEFSIKLFTFSLTDYIKNYEARNSQTWIPALQKTRVALEIANQLLRYQQYLVKVERYWQDIQPLLQQEPLILPIGCEGHASVFIKYGRYLVYCDRRRHHAFTNGILIFEIGKPAAWNEDLIKVLLYEKKPEEFLYQVLPQQLELNLVTRMIIEPQVAGNCSWANIEAIIPAVLFLLTEDVNKYRGQVVDTNHPVVQFFHHWREWDQQRALQFLSQDFPSASPMRKASFIALFTAIVFQCCQADREQDLQLAARLLKMIHTPQYEYIVQQYLNVYCIKNTTQVGANFKRVLELASLYG